MADSYTDRLGLIAQEEGQHANEWGDLLNLNFQRIDSATRGYILINLAGAKSLDANDITTTGSTAQEESFFKFIEFKGTAGTVTVPAENIMWIVYNNTGSNFTFQPSGGTGVTLTDGKVHFIVYGSNGTTFTDVTNLLFTNFTSTGIDDNATSTALTLDTSQNATFTNNVRLKQGPGGGVIFDTDLDTFIYASADDVLEIWTANAQAMTINASQQATFLGDLTIFGQNEFNSQGTDRCAIFRSDDPSCYIVLADDTLSTPTSTGINSVNGVMTLSTNGTGTTSLGTTALTLDTSQNATFSGKISAEGGPFSYTLQTGTTYTASNGDFVVASNTGTVTITLPAASVNASIIVKKTGSGGTVTVDGNASETIDGALTYVMSTQYQSVTLISDGSGWLIV